MPKSPEQNLMSHDEAENEAKRMNGKIERGEARDYDEAEKILTVEDEKKKN